MNKQNYLCDNLRELRYINQKTQDDIAQVINVSRQTVSKWEKNINEPDLYTLIALAEYYKITLDDLVTKDWSAVRKNETAVVVEAYSKTSQNKKNEPAIFPRADAAFSEGKRLFQKAYKLDISMDEHNDQNGLGDAIDLYWEAFDKGVPEAGVNLLRIISNMQLDFIKENMLDEFQALKITADSILDRLYSVNHPAEEYYSVIRCYFGLDSRFDSALSWQLLNQLVDEGNPYAIAAMEEIKM